MKRLLDDLKKQQELLEKGLFPITDQSVRQLTKLIESAHAAIVELNEKVDELTAEQSHLSWLLDNLRHGGPL